MLHGRDAESATVGALVEEARSGRAGSLVITGGAGIGKSALLDDAAARAVDATVLRTAGLESESPLAFAALQRLLRPVMARADGLPPPQARALRMAFGEVEGDRIDPFLVALATLSLLTEVGDSGPVLCLVDDAHWIDVASAEALLFAARRLLAEPVAIVFAARDDADHRFAPDDVAQIRLEGLSAIGGQRLAARADRAGPLRRGRAAPRRGDRGNPLALVELPGRLSPEQLKGTAALPDALPISDRVERKFLDRCRRLSSEAQTLMLLTSADDSGRVSVLARAAAALSVPSETLARDRVGRSRCG